MQKRIFIISLILFLFSISLAKDLPKAAKIVPPNTIVLINTEDFAQLQKQFEKTNFYKFYKDPAMAPFMENVRTKLREKVTKLDGNNIFKTFFDMETWPQGKAAFAVVPNSAKKNLDNVEVIFISQWGKNITKIKEAVNKLLDKNSELGGHKKAAEDYRGVKIETMVDEKKSDMAYCYIDDCFIASSDAELLKFTVAHIQNAAGASLGDQTDFTSGLAATGPFHDVDVFINLKEIIKTTIDNDSNGEDRSFIKSLGFENVNSVTCSLGMNRRSQSGCSGKILVKIDGAKKGICKMLEMDSEAFRIPKFIPGSAFSVTVINLNAKKVYDELYNIVFSMDPMSASAMCAPIVPPSPDGQPGLVLKSDIIEHLGSQIIIAECLNKPFTKPTDVKDMLLAIGVNNKTALEKSLSKIHNTYFANGNPDAKKELLGHTIYLLDASAFFSSFSPGQRTPMADDDAGPRKKSPMFAFTLTENYLIFGKQEIVENSIRLLQNPGSNSIDSTKWFVQTKQLMPSVLGLAAMEDNSANAELLWWLMKETAKNKKIQTLAAANPQLMLARGAFDTFDFGLLPPFEAVRKYFNLFGMYGQSRPDGFFFEFSYLNSPAASE